MIFDQAKNYLILGLVAALVVGGGFHWSRVTYLERKITTLTEENNTLNLQLELAIDTNKKLVGDVRRQNESIRAYANAASAAREQADLAIAKAKADSAAWRKKYEKVLSEPPANPADLCGSLDLRLSQYIDYRAGEVK